MQKRILITNGSYTDIPLIKAYKEMGLYVITSGNNPSLLGHKYADEYVPHDYSDYKGMLKIAEQLNIDYVSPCANDFGSITAAYIAENLGLPGNDTFENARLIGEKDRFKTFAQANNLQVIPSARFDSEEDAFQFALRSEYPIIIKPTDLSGGKGVARADSFAEAKNAITKAFACSKAKHIVIEPFIEGIAQSVMTFLLDGKVVSCMSYNEYPSPHSPYLVGSASSPIFGYHEIAPIVFEQIEKLASLRKLKDGIFHAQYRVKDGKPLIMECMRRCLGNYALLQARITTGFEWEKWIAKAFCGMDCSDIPRKLSDFNWSGEFYIQAPHNGVVKSVSLSDKLKPYIDSKIMQWEPGMRVEHFETEMLGFVLLRFPDEKMVNTVMNNMYDYIMIEME